MYEGKAKLYYVDVDFFVRFHSYLSVAPLIKHFGKLQTWQGQFKWFKAQNARGRTLYKRKIEHKFELPCKESIFNCVTHVNSAKLVSPQAAGSRHIDGDDDVTVEWRHVE